MGDKVEILWNIPLKRHEVCLGRKVPIPNGEKKYADLGWEHFKSKKTYLKKVLSYCENCRFTSSQRVLVDGSIRLTLVRIGYCPSIILAPGVGRFMHQ